MLSWLLAYHGDCRLAWFQFLYPVYEKETHHSILLFLCPASPRHNAGTLTRPIWSRQLCHSAATALENEWKHVLIFYTFVAVDLLFGLLANRNTWLKIWKTGTKHSKNFHNCIPRHRNSVQNTIPWHHSHLSSVSLQCLVNKKLYMLFLNHLLTENRLKPFPDWLCWH